MKFARLRLVTKFSQAFEAERVPAKPIRLGNHHPKLEVQAQRAPRFYTADVREEPIRFPISCLDAGRIVEWGRPAQLAG